MEGCAVMKVFKGVGVSNAIAVGRLKLYKKSSNIPKKLVSDKASEQKRFEAAQKAAIKKTLELYEKSVKEFGLDKAEIFEVHAMMMEDQDYTDCIRSIIEDERVNAEYAVQEAGRIFSKKLLDMDDEYMKQRGADVIDISRVIIHEMLNLEVSFLEMIKAPAILAAADLMPSETVQLDRNLVLAIVTKGGSSTSHTAILAHTLGIPAVMGLGNAFDELEDGCHVIVDGFSGFVITHPDEETIKKYNERMNTYLQEKDELLKMLGRKSITLDGTEIELYANIGRPDEAAIALENGAEGIGLFRSEFLFMENSGLPTEEQQFKAYSDVLKIMQGKRVVVRTIDIGADKHVPYLQLPHEENPALGCRGVRLCLDKRDIFTSQLRALLRASMYGKLAIMVPMITTLDEVRAVKDILNQVKLQLDAEGLHFAEGIEFGIMIETPAAAMISDLLAKEVDFFSIGTNDLTQYTMAVDRMNKALAGQYDPRHLSVLRLMAIAAQNAARKGIWTGICGELSSDQSLLEIFLAMGIRELSVAASEILPMRRKICETDIGLVKQQLMKELMPEGYL
jgi:phosphoenolpyruvate-protein phosphotransferase (PTS system enzyme I)